MITRRRAALLLATALAACTATPPPAPSAQDARDIDAAQAYLDGLTRFTARFTQEGADSYAEGYVWLDRPGRMRVEYVRPVPRTILVNHGRLLVADHLNGALTTMPVARTPLDILVAPRIRLSGAVRVTAVQHQPGAFSISLVKADDTAQGMLTFQFSENPLTLYGLTIQNAAGRANTLALTDLARPAAIDPARFTYQPGHG